LYIIEISRVRRNLLSATGNRYVIQIESVNAHNAADLFSSFFPSLSRRASRLYSYVRMSRKEI
jgi:hypothetical protein